MLETTPAEARRLLGPERRCITDPRRSRRQLYIRLETWLAREAWATFNNLGEREDELAQRLGAEVHYIQHLRKKRPGPCSRCPEWVRARFGR